MNAKKTLPQRELTLVLDGHAYEVSAEGDAITVNGRRYTVEVESDTLVFVDGIAYQIEWEGEQAIVDRRPLAVQTRGTGISSTAGTARTAPVPAAVAVSAQPQVGSGTVVAVMPGKIMRVPVKVGQRVEIGEPVCVLEAMKMENELRAPEAGVVRAVYVRPGDDVRKDQPLIEIE